MIFATVNLTIKEDESVCDENITLYRGDKNVQVRFVLVNNIFKVTNQTYAQMIIIRPSKESLFTQTEKILNDTVVLTITEEMIDELKEVGGYTFQIRLYDDTRTSRITLPPCNSGLYVGEPIAIESGTRINDARINFATVEHSDDTIDVFDEEGNYNTTEWFDGDIISDFRMNKIENALYSINEKASASNGVDLSGYVTDEELEAKGYLTDIPEEYVTDEELEAKGYLTEIPEELQNDVNDMKNNIDVILTMVDEPPTYIKPTISVSLSNGTIEHNKSYDISITANYNKNDAGDITSYKVYKNNVVIFENTSIVNHTDTITISHGGSVTYKAEVVYGDGPIKNTTLGIPYPSTSIKSGSISATNIVKAYALSYYGIINTSEFVDTSGLTSKLRTSKSDTITVSLTNQRIIYMYPKTFGNLTSIKDANNFDYINSYTLTTATVNGIEYNIYILTDPVTITNFKQIFN